MMYFRMNGLLTDGKWLEENNDSRVMKERARRICMKTEDFNQKLRKKAAYFVADVAEGNLSIGILCRDKYPLAGQTKAYFKSVGLEPTQLSQDEITFSSIKSLLRRADRGGFINDDDEFLELYELDKWKEPVFRLQCCGTERAYLLRGLP